MSVLFSKAMICIFLLAFIISFFQNHNRIRNGFYLSNALVFTIFELTVLYKQDESKTLFYLLFIFLIILTMIAVLLIRDGFIVVKKEGRSIPHLLPTFFGIFLFTGELAFVLYIFGSTKTNIINFNKIIGLYGFTVFYLFGILLNFIIYSLLSMRIPHDNDFDYLVVHGYGLIGGKIPKVLSGRLDTAIEIYKSSKVPPMIIVSGGKGNNNQNSEAHAMALYLEDHGIPMGHIIEENQSINTMENIINCKQIIMSREGSHRTALISSNWHIYRCVMYAMKQDFQCTGFGSFTAWYYWLSALLREFLAIFTEHFYMIIIIVCWLPILLLVVSLG